MIRAVTLLLALAGCYETGSFPCVGPSCESPTDGTTGDGSEMICVGAAPGLLGEKCFVPRESVTFPEMLDTGTSDLCDLSEDAVCFITGMQLMLPSRMNVTGARPLVLWGADSITIGDNGHLDVASHSDATDKKIGPGSNPSGCEAGDGEEKATTVPNIGGGGTGGAYGSAGGGGGGARNADNTIINPIAGPPSKEMTFRGGCNGGKGGYGNTNVGFGGGAVYLMAKNEITVGGLIDASGSGGTAGFKNGATRYGGGNGGGSGGLIGIEAPTIKLIGARLAAMGGAGGSGAANNGANDGQDPQPAPPMGAPASQATTPSNGGGAGCSITGSSGGAGGTVSIASGGEGGGGGGGGGCGFIMTLGTLVDDTGAMIAPPATAL